MTIVSRILLLIVAHLKVNILRYKKSLLFFFILIKTKRIDRQDSRIIPEIIEENETP